MSVSEVKTIKFELTLDEANKVLAAIGKQKINSHLPLYQKMQTQAYAQINNVMTTNVQENS
jgi:hypothetical protein